MDEDVVTRLRTVVAVPNGVDIWTMTALEAADEIERLRAAGDALAEALQAVFDEHEGCWCPDPRTEMPGTCLLCDADEGWQEARRG